QIGNLLRSSALFNIAQHLRLSGSAGRSASLGFNIALTPEWFDRARLIDALRGHFCDWRRRHDQTGANGIGFRGSGAGRPDWGRGGEGASEEPAGPASHGRAEGAEGTPAGPRVPSPGTAPRPASGAGAPRPRSTASDARGG